MNYKKLALATALSLLTTVAFAKDKDRGKDKTRGERHMTEHQKDVMSKMSKKDRQYTKDHIAFANDGRAYIDPDRGPMPTSMANLNKMLNDKISFSVGVKQGAGISHFQYGKSSDSPDHAQGRNGRTSAK